jgi:hypothetical protein
MLRFVRAAALWVVLSVATVLSGCLGGPLPSVSKRTPDGRWPLKHALHDELLVDLGEREDQPSRWITLRALRVLRWAEMAGRGPASVARATSSGG